MQTPFSFTDTGSPSAPILFFIHGWPDSSDLWKSQVAHFSKTYRCIAVTLPCFGKEHEGNCGDNFPTLVDRLAATISTVTANSAKKTVTVVGHDWGAHLTYLLDQRHPELIERLITMDVGAHLKPVSWQHSLFLVGYQWWLASAYFVGKILPPLADGMTRAFAKKAQAPRYPDVNHHMNYLYVHYWRARFSNDAGSLPFRYRPSKPILFLFGEKKKYPFHSPRWEKTVTQTPGSKVVGLPGCDHWLMARDPQLTNSLMEAWLSATKLASRT